jgi:hypothetical protein
MTTSQDDYKQNLNAKHARKSDLRGKIDATFVDCTYDPNDVDLWLKQVENYCGYPCYLYSVRPTLINTK